MSSSLTLVSGTSAGVPGVGDDLSDAGFASSGTKVIFVTDAKLLLNGVFDGYNVYLKDLTTGALTLLSSSSAGVPANGDSGPALYFSSGSGYSFTPDNHLVYFASNASNLVANDTNGTFDLFAKDLVSGAVTKVLDNVGDEATANIPVFLSPDSNKIFFQSAQSSLVAGDTNGATDVFVRDVTTGTITRVSTTAAGAQANGASHGDYLSTDGSRLIFESTASNLVAADTSSNPDLFVKNLTTGAVTLVTASAAGVHSNGSYADYVGQSGDGNVVFFESDASNLTAADTAANRDLFAKNLTTGAVTLVSSTTAGAAAVGAGDAYFQSVSADGTKVLFTSSATQLVAGDFDPAYDLFLKDLTTGATTRLTAGGPDFPWVPVSVHAVFLGNTNKIGIQQADASQGSSANNGMTFHPVSVYDMTTHVSTLLDYSVSDDSTPDQGYQSVFNISPDGAKVLLHANNQIFVQPVNTAGLVTLQGDAGANTITGTAAEEIINGGNGDDILGGSSGHDYLLGGSGNDTYIVVDSSVGVFEQAGAAWGVDVVQASVSFDLRNSGSVENLTLTGTGDLFGIGNDLANVLNGNAGNNILVAGGGLDTLNGGDGNDFLSTYDGTSIDHDVVNGGNGNDTLDCGAYEFVDGGAGTDSLSLDFDSYYQHTGLGISLNLTAGNNGGALSLVTGGTIVGVEAIRTWATGANDTVTDAAWDGQIAGLSGNDTLSGADGNDVLMGGSGTDNLDGGNGADWLFGGQGNDTVSGGAGDDHIGDVAGYLAQFSANTTVIDPLHLGDFQQLANEDLNDPGTDVLNGGDGNDVIFGNAAINVMNGGAGADTLNGRAGAANIASYAASLAGVTVFLAGPQLNTGEAAGDTYSNITGLTGSAFADILGGTDSGNAIFGGLGNDQIYGAGGDDHLVGGAGGDRLDGQAGIDTADYSSSTAGLTVFLGGPQLNSGDAAGDSYFSVENLLGSAFGDILGGDAGNNRVDGGDGSDFLFGSGGTDTLAGGNGNDVLDGGADGDRLDGGSGVDVASYRNSTAGIVLDLGNSGLNTGEAAGDVLVAVENLWGTDYNDTIRSNLVGGGQVYGFAGDDTLAGSSGNDVFYGGTGADTITTGFGADDLFFLSYSNHLNQYGTPEPYEGGDIVTDFAHGIDHITVSRYWFGFGNIAGPAAALTATNADFITTGTAATSSKPTFFWNGTTNVLEFDPDGTGASAKVLLGTLIGATLTLSDIWTA